MLLVGHAQTHVLFDSDAYNFLISLIFVFCNLNDCVDLFTRWDIMMENDSIMSSREGRLYPMAINDELYTNILVIDSDGYDLFGDKLVKHLLYSD